MAKLEKSRISYYYDKLKTNFYTGIDVEKHVKTYEGLHDPLYAEPEFTGKFVDICMHYYMTDKNEKALFMAQKVIKSILKNQREDGYLGCFEKGNENKIFSVWNQAFTILGMVSYAKVTKSEKVMASALKCIHNIYEMYKNGENDIFDAQNDGSENISILYPAVKLWELTHDEKTKEFIDFIIEKCENSTMNIISFDKVENLMSQKGIEMLVIFIGLTEYAKSFNDRKALDGAERYWEEINKTQIRNTGNGTVAEFWKKGGNEPAILKTEEKPNENCVAVGWCELSLLIFSEMQESKYLDAFEETFYNHILGSVADDGTDFAYYQGNWGKKVFYTNRDMYQCCRYRGFTLFSCLPDMLYFEKDNVIIPVLYTASQYENEDISIICETDYPKSGKLLYEIDSKKKKVLKLRIPDFCKDFNVRINGVDYDCVMKKNYVEIEVVGKTQVELYLKYELVKNSVTIDNEKFYEFKYGPLLLATDTRYGGSLDDKVKNNGSFEKIEDENTLSHFVYDEVHLVDYASAGRGNNYENEYSVWIKAF